MKNITSKSKKWCPGWYLKYHKRLGKSLKRGSKSIKNRNKWCPGTLRKGSQKKVDSRTLPGGARKVAGGGPWAPLGRFWAPFGAELNAQGLRKSSFLASGCAKMSKNEVQNEASEKAWFFYWIEVGKCEILYVLDTPKCFVYKHFGGFRRLWQNLEFQENPCPNGSQKSSQNRPLGDQGFNFWGFGRVFEGSDFWWIFDRPKVCEILRVWHLRVG